MKILSGTLLICLIFSGLKAGAGETLTPMRIQHCSSEFCFELKSEKGFKSPLDPNVISFNQATLTVLDKDGKKILRQEQGESGYLDSEINFLILRKINGNKSLMLNSQTGKITVL